MHEMSEELMVYFVTTIWKSYSVTPLENKFNMELSLFSHVKITKLYQSHICFSFNAFYPPDYDQRVKDNLVGFF